MNHPCSWRLWPRGRLDLGWKELLYATIVGCFPGATPRRFWPTSAAHLVAFSVRTAWDALLAVQRWQPGSEVLFSEGNIEGMVAIIKAHGLVPVPIPLNPRTLTVERGEVEALITPQTKAILISPLFGSRPSLSDLAEVARRHNLLLVEDNAQAFVDCSYLGSPVADVTLFSFGLIKRRTALGGAVVFARDPALLSALRKQMQTYPRVSKRQYLRGVRHAALLHLLGNATFFGLFWRLLQRHGHDPDAWISRATKSMRGPEFLKAIRYRAHRGTLKLLHRRLRQDQSKELAHQIWRGKQAGHALTGMLGRDVELSTFWALPVCVSRREELILQARREGFDLSYRSSSLVSHSPVPTPFSRALDTAVFLPIGTPMPHSEWQRLLKLVAEFANDLPT